MTIFAGSNWIARMLNRWRARQSVGALLRRMDDHHLDDIGVTRDELNRSFGRWQRDRSDPGIAPRGSLPAGRAADAPAPALMPAWLSAAGILALPTAMARRS